MNLEYHPVHLLSYPLSTNNSIVLTAEHNTPLHFLLFPLRKTLLQNH
jgi:hypothetical protein